MIKNSRASVHPQKPPVSAFSRKRKTPSRRRRDQKRFHQFLEKKKLERDRKKRSVSKHSVQCTPPSDKTASVHTPPSLTIPSHRRLSDAQFAEVEEILTAPHAEDCFGPYLKQAYTDCGCSPCEPSFVKHISALRLDLDWCDACDTHVSEVPGGLKRCVQCMCTAYCAKKCQISHWKEVHKRECKQKQETAMKFLASQWELRLVHQSRVRRRAALFSRTRERFMLISPYVGIIPAS